jgi:glycosyltransferase involved in cell wall biosynthesis
METEALSKRKIAVVLPSLRIGGSERVLLNLCNQLALKGWGVDLLLFEGKGGFQNQVHNDINVSILNVKTHKRAIFKLAKYYKNSKPDLVLTSTYATGISATLAKYFSVHKCKVIVSAHNSIKQKIMSPDNLKDRFLLKFLARLLIPKSDGLIACSVGVAEEIKDILSLGQAKVETIYNPIVSPVILERSKEEIKHRWFYDVGGHELNIIVAVARLVPQKGIPDLLRAFSIVRQQIDCRLIVVGDGPMRQELQSILCELFIEDSVDFIGAQENPYAYIAKSRLFVLSSLWEGLPTILVEAMYIGTPVVATDCNFGPREILCDGKFGLLATPGNPSNLAKAIIMSLHKKDVDFLRDLRISRANEFSIELVTDRYIKFFGRLLQERL